MLFARFDYTEEFPGEREEESYMVDVFNIYDDLSYTGRKIISQKFCIAFPARTFIYHLN